MVKLVIDASNGYLSLSCFKNKQLLNNFETECKINLSEVLLLEIDNILKKSKIKKTDLTEIIITKGPGSYTALRVVMSVAKTFSFVLSIKIKMISSLILQAGEKIQNKNVVIVPIIDGRRDNVYSAVYFNKKELLDEGYYSIKELLEFLNTLNKEAVLIGSDVNNFNYENLLSPYTLFDENIKTKNLIFVEEFLEDSDYYNAKPSYLRLTEAERNLKNDKN